MTYIPRNKRTKEQQAEAAELAKAKADALSDSITERLEVLSQALAGGRSEEFLKYLTFSAKFHHYSFGNQLLIMMQAPDAARVAGYRAWQAVGRQVKKGAKAISILRPILVRDREKPVGEDGKHPLKKVGCKYVSVFADYDTEGEAMPDFMTVRGQEDKARAAFATALEKVRAQDIPVREEACGSAHGYTDGGVIVIDPAKCDAEPAHALRVLFHEWAHVKLHFNEKGLPADDRPSRKVRELEADAAAFVLCSFYGVDTTTQTADYVANWGGKPDALKASMKRIQKAVSAILTHCGQGRESEEGENVPDAA